MTQYRDTFGGITAMQYDGSNESSLVQFLQGSGYATDSSGDLIIIQEGTSTPWLLRVGTAGNWAVQKRPGWFDNDTPVQRLVFSDANFHQFFVEIT